MGYFIFERAPCRQPAPEASEEDRLEAMFEQGDAAQRRAAWRQLVQRGAEDLFTRCLASADTGLAKLAIDGLWECWQSEMGPSARAEMDAGIAAMSEGDLEQASALFQALSVSFPDWAEALNKQATVLYLRGMPEESIALCRRALELKPCHFGAWNGLALCAIQVEDWPLALEAVRHSLRLQPQSVYNHQLLRLVESRLPPA